jgi:hypothetical protein
MMPGEESSLVNTKHTVKAARGCYTSTLKVPHVSWINLLAWMNIDISTGFKLFNWQT